MVKVTTKRIGQFFAGAAAVLASCIIALGGEDRLGNAGTLLEVEAETSRPVSITSAQISGEDVVLNLSSSGIPSSDDGLYYIYADKVYEDGAEGNLVAQVEASSSTSVTFPLNFDTEESNLSRKFLVAVKQGGEMVQVSDEHYITNPEAIAASSAVRFNNGIKGLFIDPSRISTGEVEDLGVQQVAYNIYIGDIVGESSDPTYPTTYFIYDGITYAFDTYSLTTYDNVFFYYTQQGMEITVNIINNLTEDATDLIHPLALDGTDCPCYAFNTVDEAGTKHLEAIAYFLGQRYNGSVDAYGQVDNWVVGNEVNARTEQFYMSSSDLDENVNAYHKAFRIFYNGLKAGNGSCMVYNSIDQEWNRLSNSGSFYAREYLDSFNAYILREGNIDWGLSFHPYNSPLYDPYTWLGLSVWVGYDLSTPYITMQNLYLLIDYMHQSEFLNPSSQVRSIVISEIGFTSHYGDAYQCASIAYAYLQADYYDDIDGFLMYRQTDNAHEMESNIAQGLIDLNGNKKAAYDYYKYINTDEAQYYKDQASLIMGYDIDSLIGLIDFPTRDWTGY